MPRVLIQCPETGRPVYTGMNFDWLTFDSLQLGEKSIDCPECGKRHVWTRQDAILQADGGEG